MFRFLVPLLVVGGMTSAAAQSLNGLDVHGTFDVEGNAELDLIDDTKTVGPGVEFRYEGNEGFHAFADFEGSTLTVGMFMSRFTFNSDLASWDFELTGDRRFTSITPLTDNFPRPVDHGISEGGVIEFGFLPWDGSPANSTFTATYQVAFTEVSNPIPEPSTYALMFAGLAIVAGFAGKRCGHA